MFHNILHQYQKHQYLLFLILLGFSYYIHLNTTITGDEEILKTCDYIIVSTGALPFTPAIPGIDGDNVVNIVEAHRNESLIKGNKIIVCGGGASGLDGAIEMAEEMHKDVTVVEMLPEMGKDVFFINKISLLIN